MNVDANVGMSAHFSGTKRKEVVSCTPSVSKKKKKKQTTCNRRYGAEHCSNMDYNNEAEFLSMHITNHSFIK